MTISQNPDEEQHSDEQLPPVEDIDSEGDPSEYSDDIESSENKENREDSRFKEGQILRFVRVRFPGNSRSFPFLIGKRRIEWPESGRHVRSWYGRGLCKLFPL